MDGRGERGDTGDTGKKMCGLCGLDHHVLEKICDITAVTDGRRGRKVEKSSILEGLKPQLRNNNKLVVAPKQRDLSVCFFTAWQFHRVLPSASNLYRREYSLIHIVDSTHNHDVAFCIGERRFIDPHI